MAKKITAVVKLQLPAGKATPAPPVGSTLGPFGINLPGFTKEFNAKTADKPGLIIPVVVTIYQDRSFTFILKTPPAPVLIKKALGLETASAKPNSVKVGKLTKAQVEEIAKIKDYGTIQAAESDFVFVAENMLKIDLKTGANALFNQIYSAQLFYLYATPLPYNAGGGNKEKVFQVNVKQ